MTNRQIFLQHVGQTSTEPLCLEIVKAAGVEMWDVNGKRFIDLIAGISVCNVGHCHPEVVAAVQGQASEYMHLLVYGEFVQAPQVRYAAALTQQLPPTLNSVYFTNSGAEATEGAMKLAKRYTGRSKIIAFNHSYHGSTQGALSIIGDEFWRQAYRPLLPDVYHYNYNSNEVLAAIDEQTACVIMETVQAEKGIIKPAGEWIAKIEQRCKATGTLFILDEIQTGFGRTGTLWAFEQYGVVPDILLLGKALGGGMPLGAFVADKQIMDSFTVSPVLGHITTFGGHPVSCAGGLAAFEVLTRESLYKQVEAKTELFLRLLKHHQILDVRAAGLWMAVEFDSFSTCKRVIDACIAKGLITDWFLFAPNCLRIAPPLTISENEIVEACEIILACLSAGD
ncbi:aspartate aminotransferase family protein [Segetibacter sp. 3557_3]|uniref:aspartate aminotransferase family protein n=1 Tax=Segetibacter sp. 3557_3 TaxID=2547429 RepID=UPI001058836B|nr:aspartate aminotransferase family protein [Segetibacter sp. 3557_3]TDH23345.1 aspartate aminotransferase family protein [Segetibacter sp. 3557_3]